ncbi:hypothetical protein OQA88_473 [Cercophora sp. LCS_1]
MDEPFRHHPYFPVDSVISGGYVPTTWSLEGLLLSFVGLITAHIAGALLLARYKNPTLSISDQLIFCWFILSAFLHCQFEGYFIKNHEHIGSSDELFASLWREYAQSDSRYMTSDPFMLCIESLTVYIWGPLSLAAAYCIIQRNNGIRHVLQIAVSIGHLYGVALYFGTCYFQEKYKGISYSRPEFLYYWVYYVGLNAAWAVVPSCKFHSNNGKSRNQMRILTEWTVLLLQSVGIIRRAFGHKKTTEGASGQSMQ